MDRLFVKFKSASGVTAYSNKIEVLETLLTTLIDFDSKELLRLYEKDQVFSLIISYFFEIHLPATPTDFVSLLPHTENFKCLDVTLDFLEFLIS